MVAPFLMASASHGEYQAQDKESDPSAQEDINLLLVLRRELVSFFCYGYVRHFSSYFFSGFVAGVISMS
jgi:hypothetical protein